MTILAALDWLSLGSPGGIPPRWLWMVCGDWRRMELWDLIHRGVVDLTIDRKVRRAE